MRIAALLPHVEVFGGVRRYLEIGNALARRRHSFTLFTPAGKKPDWLEYRGEVRPFEAVSEAEFDIGLCSEYSILDQFDVLKARAKCFYFVLEGHKKEKEVAAWRGYRFLGNSEGLCRRLEGKYGIRCFRASGGINPEIFFPLPRGGPAVNEFRILCYGRIYKKRKGIHNVIRAVERLHKHWPRLRLIFFDSLVGLDRRDPRPLVKTSVPSEFYLDLPQARMAWLFAQADMFAGAERRAGWSNTTAEAMACRLPVVCTASGTRDFAVHEKTALVVPFPHPWFLARQIKRLIDDPGLRRRLADAGCRKIKEFTWDALAERLETMFCGFLSGNL
ncbi:MAG: glycosyltransferase family 4 protein [Candidatus Aminicenantales bacterium]